MQGFFDWDTPDYLLHKLERDYDHWRQDPVNVDLAWNFFVTAEHLPDWLGRKDPRALEGHGIEKFKRHRALTRICAHLANGAKHFIPIVKPAERLNTSVGRAVRENTGWVEPGWVEPGWVGEEPALRVYLTPHEVAALQQDGVPIPAETIDALWLAARVLEFWQAWPALYTRPSGDPHRDPYSRAGIHPPLAAGPLPRGHGRAPGELVPAAGGGALSITGAIIHAG